MNDFNIGIITFNRSKILFKNLNKLTKYQKYFNSQGDLRKAEELIRDALYSIPTHSDAQALLGRILLELDDQEALVKWNEDLPPEVDVNPRIWVVRGRMAQRRDQGEAAARCFWEALRINPNHKLANLQTKIRHSVRTIEAEICGENKNKIRTF